MANSLNDLAWDYYSSYMSGTVLPVSVSVGQAITTATVAATIAVEGSSGTIANTLNGVTKGVTVVTGSLEGTAGTISVYLKDATAGTVFTVDVTEAASPVYTGTVFPMNTGMNWIVTADGTQSAAATVNLAVHYQK